MDATVQKREIIFKGIDGEWVFRTTFHSMGAITVVLVEGKRQRNYRLDERTSAVN